MLQLVEGFMPECAWLDDQETLTYLHSTVSTKRHRVRVPEIPMYLDALLADQPLTGGLEPMLGSAHLRVLTVVGFPDGDDARNSRRPESPGIRVSLVDPRDHARQDGCHQTPDQDPAAMVRQAEVDRRDPQGGDDQRGFDASRYRRPQQGDGCRRRAAGTGLRPDRRGLCHGDGHGLGRRPRAPPTKSSGWSKR